MARITIVSPCFNEEANVVGCYQAVKSLFDPAGPLSVHEREHIFADNASTDHTVDLLRVMAAGDPAVKVVLNTRNFGPFRSNFNALRYATGDAVMVFLAVDLQDPPAMLPDMVRKWEEGYEIVAGARIEREEGLALRTCRRLFYRIVNRLSSFEIPENVGEFQLIDRKVWEVVIRHQNHYPYVRGIIASTGFRRIILPYVWKARRRGISKNNLFALIDQALNGIFTFSDMPIRICSLAGFGIALLSVLYASFAFIVGLLGLHPASAGTHTVIVALFFLSGVQLTFIGILGEYVAAIHAQVRRGPVVVERERINIARPQAPTIEDTAP